MSLTNITNEAVIQAVMEFDSLGRELFLNTYGFGNATNYFLVYKGKYYPSKAIAGVAHKYSLNQNSPLNLQNLVVANLQ